MTSETASATHEERIKELLTPFIDSNSKLDVAEDSGGGFRVSGSRRFEDFELYLMPKPGPVEYVDVRTRRTRTIETNLAEIIKQTSVRKPRSPREKYAPVSEESGRGPPLCGWVAGAVH